MCECHGSPEMTIINGCPVSQAWHVRYLTAQFPWVAIWSLSPVMVTSPNERKIMGWDKNPWTNKWCFCMLLYNPQIGKILPKCILFLLNLILNRAIRPISYYNRNNFILKPPLKIRATGQRLNDRNNIGNVRQVLWGR